MQNVIIYTTPTCGYCKATKEFFKKHKVAYDEIDLTVHRDKARDMIEKSGQMGVPVIVVQKDDKEEIIVGFDQGRLSSVLGI